MTRSEIKDLIILSLITVLVFSVIYFIWPYTPMYKEAKAEQRLAAQEYLQAYYYMCQPEEKAAMMVGYELTIEDITPILREFDGGAN